MEEILDELKNLFHISSCCPTVNQNATLIPCLLRSGGRLRMSSFISPPVSVSPLILLPGPVCTAHFARMILMILMTSSIFPSSVYPSSKTKMQTQAYATPELSPDDRERRPKDLFHFSSCLSVFLSARLLLPDSVFTPRSQE